MSDLDNKDEVTADQATPLFTVGERAFTKEDAVSKITNADSFIETLKTESKQKDEELATLRAQLDQATKLDDALARMSTQESSGTSSQEAPTSAIDVEALKKELLESVSTTLSSKENEKRAQANQEDSISAAQAVYGADYESKLRERAKQLGMSDKDIIVEASTNPVKFKSLFGLDKTTTTTPSPYGSNVAPKGNSGKVELKTGGFTSSDRLINYRDNLRAIASKNGIKLD